jgi:ribosomal protein S18 acetylase RimI-like enzyme
MKLGSELLANAIHRSVNNAAGWAVMVVDAKNAEATAFYKRFGFAELGDNRFHLFVMRHTLENFIKKVNETTR